MKTDTKKYLFPFLITLLAIGTGVMLAYVNLQKSLSVDLFNDVSPLHENYEAIKFVQENGIVNGYPDLTFRPDSTINRGEFTKIIVETVMPGEAEGSNCFKDIKTEWFAKYVCYAREKGILSGYPDGYFRPEKPIAFSEAAKIISNTFELSQDKEIGNNESWYKKPITELGLAGAIPINIDSFEKLITRGEMAEIMYRLKADKKNKESLTFESLKVIDSVTNNTWDEGAKEKWRQEFLTGLDFSSSENEKTADALVLPPFLMEQGTNTKYPENDIEKFQPPSMPEISGANSRYNLPFPMDFDENMQPSVGIYSIEDSEKKFFDDERSQRILAGEETFDIRDYDVCHFEIATPFATWVKDDYGEKILNALTQIGYFKMMSCGSDVYDQLYLFQQKHNLAKSNIVDQSTLQAIIDELEKIRERDYKAAKNFVCSQYIIDAPKKGRSKNHLAFLYKLALSAFPKELQIEDTRRGCFEGQTFHVSSTKRAICDGLYWPGIYDDNCEIKQNKNYLLPINDFDIVSTIIHEHAHTINMGSLKWGTINPYPFYEISNDPASKLYIDQLYYKPKFDEEDIAAKKDNLCSWYGLGWSAGSKYPGYFTPYEDFAECVRMYITDGIPFRDAIKTKPVLKEKYEWLKKNVFEGREFASGDPDYLDYVDDFYDLSPQNMTIWRPEYVWDYDFHPIEGSQPKDDRNITDQPDDSGDAQIHPIYVIPSDSSDEKLDINGTIETSIRIMQSYLKPMSFERELKIDKYQGSPDISFLKIKKTNAEMLAAKDSLKQSIEAELKANGFDDEDKIYAVYYGGKANECSDSSWPPKDPGNVAIVYTKGTLEDGSSCSGDDTFTKRRYEMGYFEPRMLREILHAMGLVADCYKYAEKNGFVKNNKDLMYEGIEKWDPQYINSSFADYLIGDQDGSCDLLPGDEFLEEKGDIVITSKIVH